ncbi:hypothetical protein M3Y94_00217300 [Aphelenchoides besseyi]|nr:hypothetical protein M3Y94_00217300 [Aphelenchoides besseyi]KAI6236566.1 hypothetical protein M3Y95_00171200 [Aphelenchoides besseyi]
MNSLKMVSYTILLFFLLGTVTGIPFKPLNYHFNSLVDHISAIRSFDPNIMTGSSNEDIWSESATKFPIDMLDTPFEKMMNEYVMETKALLDSCVMEILTNESSKHHVTEVGFETLLNAVLICASEHNVPDVVLMINSLSFLFQNHTETDYDCSDQYMDNLKIARRKIESFGKNMTKPERNQFCEITNDVSKTLCTIRKECGQSDSIDSIGLFGYAILHFNVNKGVENSNDCPYESSEMGKAINPKLFRPEFDPTSDKLFTSDFCKNSMDNTTSSPESEEFPSTTQDY